MASCIIKSPLGFTKINGDTHGISSITLLNSEEKETSNIPKELKDCVFQLKAYFKGTQKQFHLKLNPKGSDFQKKVWKQLEQIPYGKTLSYLELSKQLNTPKAIRAVANANSKNPLLIVVPCHRVIGSNGSLTGYAAGLHIKKWLLKHETPCKQQVLF